MILGKRLWGYPKLVDAAFHVKDRIRNIEKEREKRRVENEKRQTNAEVNPDTSESLVSVPESVLGPPQDRRLTLTQYRET